MSVVIIYRDKSGFARTVLDEGRAEHPSTRNCIREFDDEATAVAYAESYLPAETEYAVVELYEI